MADRLKIGVVGIVHLGKQHARIYHELPDVELVALCDLDPQKLALAESIQTPFFTDYHALIPQVDAVSIATPTSTHHAIAREFLANGKHTLIEKPITLRLEEAEELIELAREKKCALQVGHVERHNPGLKRIEEIVNETKTEMAGHPGIFGPVVGLPNAVFLLAQGNRAATRLRPMQQAARQYHLGRRARPGHLHTHGHESHLLRRL